MRRVLSVLVLLLILAGQVNGQPELRAPLVGSSKGSSTAAQSKYRPGELIVKFRPASRAKGTPALTRSHMSSVLNSIPGLSGATIKRMMKFRDTAIVKLPQTISVEAAAKSLMARPEVVWAEPNYIVHTLSLPIPNDTYYWDNATNGPKMYVDPSFFEITWPYLWSMSTVQAVEAWSIYPGTYYTASTKPLDAIRVAVIDSGLDPGHPDFINAGGTSTDSALGGQIDMELGCSLFGGIVVNGPEAFADDNGHGTHVCGIVAASVNNNTGVMGVGYNATVVPIKVMREDGTGEDADAADHQIPIINLSLGGDQYSNVMAQAVNYAYYKGCLVLAAGNESSTGGGDLGNIFPGACSKVLCVTATDIWDLPAANYAGYGYYIGISAPAGDAVYFEVNFGDPEDPYWVELPQFTPIYSTAPTYWAAWDTDQLGNPFINYGHFLGTSMATPHVSGLAALYSEMKGYDINTPNGNLLTWQAIQRGADLGYDQSDIGWSPYYGFGRINVLNTLQDAYARTSPNGSLSGQCFKDDLPTPAYTIQAVRDSDGYSTSTTAQEWGLWRLATVPAGTYTVKLKNVMGNVLEQYTNVEVVEGADTPGVDFWFGVCGDTAPPEAPTIEYYPEQSTPTSLASSWFSRDTETGVVRYWVSVGTSPGAADVLANTDMGWSTSGILSVPSTSFTYYITVVAENAAGVQSEPATLRVDTWTPPALLGSAPADQKSLWRSQKNIVRLTFGGDITAPSAGQVTICEMLDGGTYGPDLSSGFTFTVENDGGGLPRILRITENAASLTHRKWYAVRNTGSWAAAGDFTVQYVVQVGDSSNDGRVLNQDVSIIRTGIPTSVAADDDRRDINGDGRILNGDASVANSRIPSNTVAKPSGH